MQMQKVTIIGAGLAGLSAALHLALEGVPCSLVSLQPSERAQSVMAEGGINAALNTMGEEDSPALHLEDTLRAGCEIADPAAVRELTDHAPELILFLSSLGVPFHMEHGKLALRNFGGQKKKRTAYARSSTGKAVMSALIDACRLQEAEGRITRYPHHEFLSLRLAHTPAGALCAGAEVRDTFTGERLTFSGPVILATGGLNGMFPGMTTGTTANSGDAAARLFLQGVRFGNLEMIQYHPTTIGIPEKRCLISEAARGEGGRLFVYRGQEPWYFMEEKYPEYGNLMPRDVVSREMYFVTHDPQCGGQVYLDLRDLPKKTWSSKLPDLREEIEYYLGIDPKDTPIPVEPGIHYFMGGIHVDLHHRTNLPGLYAAGECCCQYHGANRLGGNSMLGAIYGGKAAAQHLAAHPAQVPAAAADCPVCEQAASPAFVQTVCEILRRALGIVRNGQTLQQAVEQLRALPAANDREHARAALAEAMLISASMRRESRGAHYREDYPKRDDAYRGMMLATWEGAVHVAYQKEN